jgi:site-specific recombinase XerD
LSWRNENPLRNKSPKKGEAVEQKPLMRSTQSRMISDLRSFLAHCLSREWLSDNWATKKHKMMTTGKRKTPKQPFPEKDLMFIYRACELLTDGRGFNSKRIQTPRGFESLVFLWLMRYTGLRISDVVALRADQIVPFQISTYTHALSCRPGKTERSTGATVQIPLPNGKLPGDPDIVGALAAISLKHDQFFFFNPRVLPIYCGCVERHCDLCSAWKKKIAEATNNWRDSLTRVFNLAEKLMEKEGTSFSVHPHPHRFRHTFAARWLEAGASLRMVAQFLGDTEEVVLRHYGGFHQVENQIAAQTMAELALKRTGKQPVMQSLLNPWQPTP